MTKIVDAIYSGGMLRPVQALDLQDQQRVRLIVQTVESQPNGDRAAALRQLRSGIAEMNLHLEGPLPTRDELHDRF